MKEILIETTVTSSDLIQRLDVEEACRLFGVETSFYFALVEQGIFEVADQHILEAPQVSLFRKAVRLHIDLGVNPAGIAVILELLSQRE